MTFVVIGQNYWGKGDSLDEAKAAWKRQSGGSRKLTGGYTVIEFDDGQEFTGVDMFGNVTWTNADGSQRDPASVRDVGPHKIAAKAVKR